MTLSPHFLRPVAGALLSVLLLASCGGNTRPEPPPAAAVVAAKPVKIGLALGGGAAKGFAHIGVIKMLEANGIKADVVSGTSAGSVVGSMYAAGMGPFQLQEKAVALDESSIRDVRLFAGGLVQDHQVDVVRAQTLERLVDGGGAFEERRPELRLEENLLARL